MAIQDRRYMTRTEAMQSDIDVGLRQYMLRVYNYMASGLALTGIVAAVVASRPGIYGPIVSTPLKWVVMFAPVVVVMGLSMKLDSIRASTAQGLFWLVSVLYGVAFASIFLVYTGASIARVFFITAATFGA